MGGQSVPSGQPWKGCRERLRPYSEALLGVGMWWWWSGCMQVGEAEGHGKGRLLHPLLGGGGGLPAERGIHPRAEGGQAVGGAAAGLPAFLQPLQGHAQLYSPGKMKLQKVKTRSIKVWSAEVSARICRCVGFAYLRHPSRRVWVAR